MLVVVFINTLALAFYDYRGSETTQMQNKIVNDLNTVCTCIFIIEALLNIMVCKMPEEYKVFSIITNAWAHIDAAIIVTG